MNGSRLLTRSLRTETPNFNHRLVFALFRQLTTGPAHAFGKHDPVKRTLLHTSNRQIWQSSERRHYSDLPSTESVDFESQRIEYFFQLQNTFKNQSMSPKVKAQRLKVIILQLISVLENGEFPNQQLPFINAVINFIDQTPNPTDSFTPNEMFLLLRSVLGGMTLQDVRFIDFFPRFYNAMRESEDYEKDLEIRLHLFEIFVNYVLLSVKRNNVTKVIEAFITEEKNLHDNDVSLQVVEIVLEAFRSIKPDTETIILLAKLCPDFSYIDHAISEENMSTQILAAFFKAADEEISESFEDNIVSERLVQFLDIIETKVQEPIETYVEILYFSVKNNFDDVSRSLLEKLEKLTGFFTLEKYDTIFQPEVMFALVNASLKFNKINSAGNLIKNLEKNETKNETNYVEDEWMALLQYEAFKLIESSEPAITLVEKFNEKLSQLGKDYEFTDTESYNLILEALCWSNKSYQNLEQFRNDFSEKYGLELDSKSVAVVLDYLCKDHSNIDSVKLASQYFLELKDSVDWENDYEGFYMTYLFKLTSRVWANPEISWTEKMDVYSNVKRYEYLFDKESVHKMMESAIKFDSGNFAINVLLDQTPEVKKEDPKLKVEKYQKIFECIYDYLINKSKDRQLNSYVYKYIADYFEIPYEYYPGFVKMFIDNGDPEMALKVFADMKMLSKQSKLPPPGEEFYIYLLKSFAKYEDEEGIFKLHLAIKMDLSINLDVKLLNALMEAYAALGDPFKTRDVYNLAFSLPKEIGSNNESAYWMLKSLKYATLGHVNDFYNGLSQYDVIPDANLFAELLVANCYFEQYRTAFERLVSAEENGDYHLINGYVLKTLHNHCLHDGVRNELKTYCMKTFPEEWKKLVASGELQDNRKEYPDLLSSPYDVPTIEVKKIADH